MAYSQAMTRRAFLAAAGAVATAAAFGATGCSAAGSDAGSAADGDHASAPELTAVPETREFMGSSDPCSVRVGLIMGPPSMGLSQFILASRAGRTTNDFQFSINGVDYVGLSAAFNQGDYDICTLPSNIGPILYNNDELKNDYCVVSVNNLGALYVMTNDESVTQLSDLVGRTIYSYGEGGTPEYTIEALLKKIGMNDEVNIEFKSSPLEVLNLMQSDPACTAILPQPFVSLAKLMVTPLYIPVDLTVEWNEAFADTGSQVVTTTTIVNRAFLEEHEQAVAEYLNMAGQSVAWSLENMEDAAALQEELETFLNNDVALDAMPSISMVNLVGTEMRTALSGFLEELYWANPDSIGGALPPDEFYYLPPVGAVADKYAAAGLAEAVEHADSTGQDAVEGTADAAVAEAFVEAFVERGE